MPFDRKTILIIDDDPDMQEALVDTLAAEGYDAAAAGDGLSALAWLRSNPAPGLILTDWNMMPMNGLQFMAEFIREPQWAPIPVVLLSADSRIEEKMKLAPFVACLRKPVSLSDLFAVAERYTRV